VALIVNHQTVDAPEHGLQLELEVGNAGQSLCPIGPHRRLAAQPAGRFSRNLDDEWRGEFEIVGVMGQDTLKVMAVPCSDPIGGETFGRGLVDHLGSTSIVCRLPFVFEAVVGERGISGDMRRLGGV
jgi:hypothetical protein